MHIFKDDAERDIKMLQLYKDLYFFYEFMTKTTYPVNEHDVALMNYYKRQIEKLEASLGIN